MFIKKIIVFWIVFLSSLSFYAADSEKDQLKKELLRFVYLPTQANYEAAVKVVERENFNLQNVPYDFFPIFEELIESSDALAFNLLKKIAKKTELYSSTLEIVRNLISKDFDFFLNNIDDLDCKTTGKLVIDKFMGNDDAVEIYELYSEILQKTKNVKKTQAKNAGKLECAINAELKNKAFMHNVKLQKESNMFDNNFCEKYEGRFNEFADFVTQNIHALKDWVFEPISYCGIMRGKRKYLKNDYPYLLYHEYMFDLISQKMAVIEQPAKSYMTVVNKNLAKFGRESEEKAEYRAFIYGFFGDPEKFLKKLKGKPSFFIKLAALDLALIVNCCGKMAEYEAARENLRKVSGKDSNLLLEELILETEKILKKENRFECNGFCGKRVMIF
ncbi:hypothetical protein IKS86_05540 [bacterium]|nr:hypothetical protein [bacterium]